MFEIKLLIGLAMGLFGHLFATLAEDSARLKHRVTIKEFRELHPWQIPLSVILSVAAYGAFYELGQLTIISAIAAGYMGDSIVKKAINGVHIK